MMSVSGVQCNSALCVHVASKNTPLKISTTLLLSNLLVAGSTWAANLGELPGQTQLQSTTGNSIAQVCARFEGGQNVANPLQQQLFDTCASMVQNANQIVGNGQITLSRDLNVTELNSAIQNTATEEIALPATLTAKTSNSQMIGVMGRISALQGGATGFAMTSNDPTQNNSFSSLPEARASKLTETGGAASADSLDTTWGKWGGFANLSWSTGDKDETDREAGFDFNTYSLTAGLDYRFTERFVAGAALGYSRLNSDFDESVDVAGGGIDADTYSLSLYGLYTYDALYLNSLIGYARNDYDIKRRVLVLSNAPSIETIDATASADTNADVFLFNIGGGYDFVKNSWQYGPVLSLNYVHSDTDGYQESGTRGLNLAVDSYSVDSLTTSLGGRVAYTSNQSYGVLIPYVTAVWRHEYEDDPTTISSRYVNEFVPTGATPTILPVVTDGPDQNYGLIGIGVSGVFKNGVQAVLSYQQSVELADINQSIISLGIRMEF